jgi:DNA primase
MPSIDYSAVKTLVTLDRALGILGWRPNQDDGYEWRGYCPKHALPNDHSKSFWCRPKAGWWYCHVCKRGGSVIDLYMMVHGFTVREAAIELCARAGLTVPYIARRTARRLIREQEEEM